MGLTASPGSTKDKINEIKKNLFIDHIEIRTEQDTDVKPYIQNVDNICIKIKLPNEFLEIKRVLDEKLKACYKFLKENELLNSCDIKKVNRKDILKLKPSGIHAVLVGSSLMSSEDLEKKTKELVEAGNGIRSLGSL